ncbi:glycosyltransferase family 4 protein [Paenibacillus sp. J2TS4]|uniref:glycosyltransferase family 4 protein n=1 Tax=Paenibacillus sp. J2TS4 TaxID=2807194 RepID=UPI001B2C90CA|nr:glycosyltransferase family 4 protein [Paenibacillus sp. J2TS4]GIP33360.1 glycogen synthase [Paenibacillus sp. J2TS4]
MDRRRSLNIWVMTNEFHPNIIGGLGVVATHLTKSLSKTGMKVTVLCSSNSGRLAYSNSGSSLRTVRLPKDLRYFNRSTRSFKAAPVLRAAAANHSGKPDLIHVHSTEFAAVAAAAGSLYRIPIVYTCHSIASEGIQSPPGKNQAKLIRTASRITVPSRWQAGEIKQLFPGSHNRITVIPHGVKSMSRQSKGSPAKLLYVGRLISSKGIEQLIKAIALLSRHHKNVTLTIVGSGKIQYQKYLRDLAKKCGIAERIHWVKKSSNDAVQRMYPSYGTVIVPSKKESFCLVALEAMANGVPLVSTLSGGLKEFVDSRNAQVIPSVNSPAIARAIAERLTNPEKTRQRLIRARSTAARYRWPAIAPRYKSLFLKLRKENLH